MLVFPFRWPTLATGIDSDDLQGFWASEAKSPKRTIGPFHFNILTRLENMDSNIDITAGTKSEVSSGVAMKFWWHQLMAPCIDCHAQ